MSELQLLEIMTPFPRATYQDVIDAPSHLVAEIMDGMFYALPRSASIHSIALSTLLPIVGSAYQFSFNGPGGWWILYKPEIHLGEDVLVPDIAGWQYERMPEFLDEPYCQLAPNWVCEIFSPSTHIMNFSRKSEIYAREGVNHLWLVDLFEKSLEAFELHKTGSVVIDKLFGDTQVSLPPFDTISFDLSLISPPYSASEKSSIHNAGTALYE